MKWMKARRFFWNTLREMCDGVRYVADGARWFCAKRSISLSHRIEEAESDGQHALIASAPELLDALKFVIRNAGDLDPPEWDRVTAAVDRAEGRK